MHSSLITRLSWAFSLGACCMYTGCGGGDSTTIGPPDGGGGDSPGIDTGPGSDGNTADVGPQDAPTSNDGPLSDGPVKSDGGGDADGGFDVASVPGLVLWLDAAKGVTVNQGKVSTWADQTTNHNDASQAMASRQPSVTAQAINNLPGIHFSALNTVLGQMLLVADSASLQWGTGDFLIEAVLRYDNNPLTSYGVVYTKESPSTGGSGAGPSIFANTPPGPMLNGTSAFVASVDVMSRLPTSMTGYNDGKGHLVGAARTGTTLEIRIAGASSATKAIPTVNADAPMTPVRIGADGDANIGRLNGDIAEILAVKGSVSASDLAGIEGYLKAKYGL